MSEFSNIGYHVDYLVDGKYIGSIKLDKPDRDVIGYNGRIKAVVTEDVICTNGKKVKKGSEATTELFPLNGRIVNKISV